VVIWSLVPATNRAFGNINFHSLHKQEGDEYYKEQFANEVKDLYNVVVKTSPLVGGKRKRKR
jgi:hypothetical protein